VKLLSGADGQAIRGWQQERCVGCVRDLDGGPANRGSRRWVKSEGQQAVLALHRMREQLVKFRTVQINGLRGLLSEYGKVMPQGRAGIKRDAPGHWSD
jgi:transposase